MKVKTLTSRFLMCCILFAASIFTSFAADKLLICGDAVTGTPNDWDLSKSVVMLNQGDDVWKATIQLSAEGSFKFLTECNFDSFQYRAGDTDVTLSNDEAATLYDSDENTQDGKFKVPETANYDVVCDLNNKTVTVSKSDFQEQPLHYAALWLMGSPTAGGWEFADGTQLTQHADNPLVYSCTTWLHVADDGMKIATNKYAGWNQPMYKKDNTDDTKMVLVAGDSYDEKWYITESATYDVTVNLADMTISIKKHYENFVSDHLFIIGDAVKCGWSISNSVAMLGGENGVWTATVHLDANNGFKFLAENSFEGLTYRANAGGQCVTLTEDTPVELVSSEENRKDEDKFQVAEAGNYDITCDLNNKTITVKKSAYQDNEIPYAALWLVGNATEGGWDLGQAIVMKQNAQNPMIYETSVDLKEGEIQVVLNKFTGFNSDVYVSDEADSKKAELVKSDGDKNNWKITEAGKYNIQLNVLDNTMSIVKASTTGITSVDSETAPVSVAIYTLEGKLVSKDGNAASLAKGIYIQNGKKLVIK